MVSDNLEFNLNDEIVEAEEGEEEEEAGGERCINIFVLDHLILEEE